MLTAATCLSLEVPDTIGPSEYGIGGATPAARCALQANVLYPYQFCPDSVTVPSPLCHLGQLDDGSIRAKLPVLSEHFGPPQAPLAAANVMDVATEVGLCETPPSLPDGSGDRLHLEDTRLFAPTTALILVRFKGLSVSPPEPVPCPAEGSVMAPLAGLDSEGTLSQSATTTTTTTTTRGLHSEDLRAPSANSESTVVVTTGPTPMPSFWSVPSLRGFDGAEADLGSLRCVFLISSPSHWHQFAPFAQPETRHRCHHRILSTNLLANFRIPLDCAYYRGLAQVDERLQDWLIRQAGASGP